MLLASSIDPKYFSVPPLRLAGLIIFLLSSAAVDARIQLPPNVTVPAVIAFGDSSVDTGNNNYIQTLFRCNYPPYGKDFMGGNSTGRCCNGRIPTDIIAEEVGVKRVVPPYLDPELKPGDLLTGVSFASAGSGHDPLTAKSASVIPVIEQLNLFKDYIRKITVLAGGERANSIISNSIYVLAAGTNDVVISYFGLPLVRRAHYDFNSYTDLMLTYASSFLQELYELGARRIAVLGLQPLGCLPAERTLGSFPERTRPIDRNTVSEMFNSKLSARLKSLRSTLPQSRFVYLDFYNANLDIILNPKRYGIEEVTEGCCGTGLLEVGELCNKLLPICPDDSKYLFWDSIHPTERGYQILLGKTFAKYILDLI